MPKRFYTALAILLAAVMALSFLPIHGETEIYDTVVRLHVLANSDSEEDQALKLTVRDAVLEITTPLLRDCPDRATAAARIEDNREAIRTAAEAVIAAAGRDDLSGTVTVELGEETIPPPQVRGLHAPCRAVPVPAHRHRGGGGTQLVVRPVSAAVYVGGVRRDRLSRGCLCIGRADQGSVRRHHRDRQNKIQDAFPHPGAVGKVVRGLTRFREYSAVRHSPVQAPAV